MQTFQIRGFRDGDIDATALLWSDSWISTGLSSVNDPTLTEYRQRLATEGKGWRIHVACHEDEIIGFVAFELERSWLRQLFIKPAAKGAGIGTALLSVVKREMPGGFWLRTNAKNSSARRFYEKNGFRLERESSHPIWGQIMATYCWP